MKEISKIVTLIIFGFTALGIGALIFLPSPWDRQGNHAVQPPRVIIPMTVDSWIEYGHDLLGQPAFLDAPPMIDLGEGELLISVLNGNFYRNPVQEQIVAYLNTLIPESYVSLAFIEYDSAARSHNRVWGAPTAATRPETVTLYTQDIIGDGSVSLLLSGMNHSGEHTLTVFRSNASAEEEPFTKIADIRIDGDITVREVPRSQAFQMGLSHGQSFTIAARGRNLESDNLMDQVEIIYAFNPESRFFEQRSRTLIPGAQIEQQRVREILSSIQAFEGFASGLWHYVTPQGTVDRNQFIYFDPASRQITFFSHGTMQVFEWRNSIATRQGIHITGQNISISTIRRSIDVQLESLNGIRIRTSENLRPAFRTFAAPWDGSYRMAGRPAVGGANAPQTNGNGRLDVSFDARQDNTAIGRLHFFPCGAYQLLTSDGVRHGTYAFFAINGKEMLELRTIASATGNGSLSTSHAVDLNGNGVAGSPGKIRETFLVEGDIGDSLTLFSVRIGAQGVERLPHEGAIVLSFVEES
ncbi:MAG: pallilysin-related adhesin [Treponema sp.]|nr:pallilysin-related adhesin [Treponema sp.]